MKYNVVYDDPSKTKGMNKEDMSNNAQHVYFLQKKKAEILARKEREKSAKDVETPTASTEVQTPKLKFANDGSFLERFKQMQQQGTVSSNIKAESSNAQPSTSKDNLIRENSTLKTPSPQELKSPASIFLAQEDEVDVYQPSEYDLAKKLAEKVAVEGMHIEAEAKKKYQGDLRYQFLHDPSNPVSSYYQSQLRECKRNTGNERKRRWDDKNDTSGSSQPSASHSSSSSSSSSSSTQSSTGAAIDPVAEFAKAKALLAAKVAAINSSSSIPTPSVVSEEEKKRQKAIDEQRMMNELYRKVIEQQAFFAQERNVKKKKDDVKYEYDSDEDTEGGTWEHKKRKAEMEKTQEWAGGLTDRARGKHHLSDFLPPEELEKFMENVKAVQEGRQADISDYAKFRIQADNVGFQLLQKAGWEEGSGLGKKGDGIVQPVNKGKTSFEQGGLGTEKPMDVKKDDDDFELYRKRMMLAYKFRPNPMNNPRRPYY